MTYARNQSGLLPLAQELDRLRVAGVSDIDIEEMIALQGQQRGAGVPVTPLAVMAGIDACTPLERSVLSKPAASFTPRPNRGTLPRPHITGRPIWGGSVKTDSPEESDYVRPVARREANQLLHVATNLACKRNDLRTMARSRPLDAEETLLLAFTPCVEKVFRKLVDTLRRYKGHAFPSYATIAEWCGIRLRTVAHAVKALRALGLIDWIRRYDYSVDPILGARSKQVSNRYRCALPEWIARKLGFAVPLPDDERQRRNERLERDALMLSQADGWERKRYTPDDRANRAALLIAAERAAIREVREASCVNDKSRDCKNSIPPLENKIFNERALRSCPGRATRQP
jgi:hypothetical protein